MIRQYDIVQLQDGRIAIVAEVLEPGGLFLVDVFEEIPPSSLLKDSGECADNDDENDAGFTIADLVASSVVSEQVYFSDIVNVIKENSSDLIEGNDLGYGR